MENLLLRVPRRVETDIVMYALCMAVSEMINSVEQPATTNDNDDDDRFSSIDNSNGDNN